MAEYGNNYDYGESPYYKDEDAPIVADNFYCDFGKIAVGVGSEIDPFNHEQFINFFDPTDGAACNVVPSDGDAMNVKGVANLINGPSFIHMNQAVIGTVTVRPWDWIKNGIFLVETIGLDSSNIYVVANEGDLVIDHLVVEGFALLQNNAGTPVVHLTNVATTNPFLLELKNYQIYCRDSDIDCIPSDDFTSKHYGFTYYANDVTIGDIGGTSVLSMQDGVIKADNIYESFP